MTNMTKMTNGEIYQKIAKVNVNQERLIDF